MTREEIIRMAREAGFEYSGLELSWESVICTEELERFAELVASAAVRETSAEYRLGWNDGQIAEREACAKVCEEGIANADDWNSAHWDQACENRAWAIRARGQA